MVLREEADEDPQRGKNDCDNENGKRKIGSRMRRRPDSKKKQIIKGHRDAGDKKTEIEEEGKTFGRSPESKNYPRDEMKGVPSSENEG